jgi:predicted patatin/cPLA2 family phospholipase
MLHTKQEDIFDNNPFKITIDKNNKKQIGIHHLNVLKNFISGRKTFGESNNLRTHILQNFPESIFEEIKSSKKQLIVTVSNLSLSQLEYKEVSECSYNDFVDWTWISCNFIPFMSLVKKDNNYYADGGLGVSVAIEEAIRRGATEIYTIILDVEKKQIKNKSITNPFSLLSVIYSFTKGVLEQQNIVVAKDFAKKKDASITYFYTPDLLTSNALILDEVEMKKWWKMGYDVAKKQMNSA